MLVKGVKVSLLVPPLLGYVMLSMAEFTTGVILIEYIEEFNITNAEAGALFSIFIALCAAATFFAGNLSDRIGTKSVMATGLGLFFAGYLLASYSSDYPALLLAYALAGIGKGCYSPSLFTYIGGLLPKSRGFLVGLTVSSFKLGAFIGPWILGYLTSQYGWRFSLRAIGIIGILEVVLQLVLVKAPKTHTSQTSTNVSYRKIFAARNIIIAIIAVFAVGFALASTNSWTPTFLRSFQGLDIASAGLVFGVYSLGGLMGSSILGYLSDRIGLKTFLVLTGIISAPLAYIYFAYHNSLTFLLVFSTIFGFFAGSCWALITALAQKSVAPEASGTATGAVQGTAYIPGIISPLAVAWLTAASGLSSAMIISVAFTFLIYGIVCLGIKGRLINPSLD